MGALQVLGDAYGMNLSIARILRRRAARRAVNRRLVYCASCGSAFVNPLAWREFGELEWWMRLRCGECGFVRDVEVSNEEAARYNADLDHGIAQIASAVARLDRQRMIAESDTWAAALERDLIDPGDFRRR
jgi:hypothetical protein